MSDAILVTGGAGYIGAHTAQALAEAGYTPVVLDNFSNGHRESVQWGPLVQADISDADAVAAAIRQYGIKAVLHFAAYIEVGESMQNPFKYFENNVSRTLRLLETLQQNDVRRIVFSSTCAVYGPPEVVPITEAEKTGPISPYGETKLMVERLLHWYQEVHGLRFAALRYFNAAGADPVGTIGERHDPETHLVPLVLQAAAGRRADIAIFGTDYDTPDGTAIRDYIHVRDLAQAHVLALGRLLQGSDSMTLNLGTGTGHSVREVIDTAARVTGRKIPVREAARREGDPPRLVADPARARELLGWQATCSDLPTILADAWRFHEREWGVQRQEAVSSPIATGAPVGLAP
jgi:UDP-glucose-4-epimerase GalE